MLAYVRGPMVWIALIVFVSGSAYQILRLFLLSRKAGPVVGRVPASPGANRARNRPIVDRLTRIRNRIGLTVFGTYPITATVSTVFHVSIFLTPLFLLGHNVLIELSLGVSLPSFPEAVSDGLTLVVILCCAFFLARRMVVPKVRVISSFSDYLVLGLAGVPFLSGFLAYHQIYDYQTVMLVHMISGELMLIAIPFTKLTHMTFFFFNRFLVVNEHTLGSGKRIW